MARRRPFADKSYILDQVSSSLIHRLERVAPRMPSAARLLTALAEDCEGDHCRLMAETTLRTAITQAHDHVVSGSRTSLTLADCEAVFASAARRVKDGSDYLGGSSNLGLVWTPKRSDDGYGRALRQLVADTYGLLPTAPGAERVSELATGAELLCELLPALGPSALSHAQIIACMPSEGVFTGVASSSQLGLGGMLSCARRSAARGGSPNNSYMNPCI